MHFEEFYTHLSRADGKNKNGEHNFTRHTDVAVFDAAHLIAANRYYLHRHRVVIFIMKFQYFIETKKWSASNIRHSDRYTRRLSAYRKIDSRSDAMQFIF